MTNKTTQADPHVEYERPTWSLGTPKGQLDDLLG